MKRKKIIGLLITALILALIAYFVYKIGFSTLSNQDALTQYIRQYGIYAPLAFSSSSFSK